jgi:hypothetical protein
MVGLFEAEAAAWNVGGIAPDFKVQGCLWC